MESLKKLYKIGYGPSSSHTMGPRLATNMFLELYPGAAGYEADLFGSLAATGKGHLTDKAIKEAMAPRPVDILWYPNIEKPFHPNAMTFKAKDASSAVIGEKTYYSIGGGQVVDDDYAALAMNEEDNTAKNSHLLMTPDNQVYPNEVSNMEKILAYCDSEGIQMWELALRFEGDSLADYIKEVWNVMKKAVEDGLESEGVLPGGLKLPRKAGQYYQHARDLKGSLGEDALAMSFALAVAEQNAGGGQIVTAPTCGSCGVLPGMLYFYWERMKVPESRIIRALLTAGIIGNVVKTNGSISGAEVGCQGEVGVACAMASGAGCQILGGSIHQIEYAAEMGLEHHLGLTCDPMKGLVQIPCIERNAMAATRAVNDATFALLSDGRHRVSFDDVVDVMMRTGHAIPSLYRETSKGGLATLTYSN